MHCPKCGSAFETIAYHGVEIDRCTGCGGIHFDDHEEEALKKLRGAASIDTGDTSVGARNDEITNINCAKCGTSMLHVYHPGPVDIRFERCPMCKSSYFDAGEFTIYVAEEQFDEFESVMAELDQLESGQNLVDG